MVGSTTVHNISEAIIPIVDNEPNIEYDEPICEPCESIWNDPLITRAMIAHFPVTHNGNSAFIHGRRHVTL